MLVRPSSPVPAPAPRPPSALTGTPRISALSPVPGTPCTPRPAPTPARPSRPCTGSDTSSPPAPAPGWSRRPPHPPPPPSSLPPARRGQPRPCGDGAGADRSPGTIRPRRQPRAALRRGARVPRAPPEPPSFLPVSRRVRARSPGGRAQPPGSASAGFATGCGGAGPETGHRRDACPAGDGGAGSPLPGTALTPFPPRLFAGSREAPAPLRPGEGGQDAAPEPGGGPQCPCSPAPPDPSPSPGPERLQARRQLSIACTVCCVFMVGEVIGGYLAHSLAIMTDAAHLLTDVGSMSVSLFSLWVSARPPTKTMSFGWHRSETLGALASVLSIWVVTGALVYLAAARIISNDYEIEARAMLATSASAVGVNLVMAYILHQAPAIHGHGMGGYEQLESAGGCLPGHAPLPGSTSVRAAFVHVVGDLLQSIGVLVAATIIYFKPQCKIADPISTLFFSVFVLGSTLTILRDVFRVLMEGAPRGIEFNAVKEVLLAVSGVRGTHDLHIWALTLSHPVVSVHVAVDASANPETVLREATSQLQSKFGFVSCTVQVERYQEEALGCPHCQDPRA
ncbi:probable proton-coupled zinc antiporter SLC30A3 isoform X1 [Anas acuta]|uniref:probable proton-coupled zinc antiporter SLC30A3 isoform X1 n=1 Tax=Anas acuta TaxID=28680 RepID=UPI0035C90595